MSSCAQDARDHALVAVAARHLVAGLDLALHRDEDLDHLHHAGRQLVAALQLFDLVEEAAFQPLLGLVVLLAHRLDLAHQRVVVDGEHPPLRARIFVQPSRVRVWSFLKPFGPEIASLPVSISSRRA